MQFLQNPYLLKHQKGVNNMNGANKSTTVLESIAAILNPENNNVTDQALNLNDIESSINILKAKLHQEEILQIIHHQSHYCPMVTIILASISVKFSVEI